MRLAHRAAASRALADLTSDDCDAYLAHRRYSLDDNGIVVGERQPGHPAAGRPDHHRPAQLPGPVHRRPGAGRPAALGRRHRLDSRRNAQRHEGRTRHHRSPTKYSNLLAAALYLVDVLGPHAVELSRQLDDATGSGRSAPAATHRARLPDRRNHQLLADYEQPADHYRCCPTTSSVDGSPPGWSPDDPLIPIAPGLLARQAGFTPVHPSLAPHLRGRIERRCSSSGQRSRSAATPLRRPRRRQGAVAWTLPLRQGAGRRPDRNRPHRGDHAAGRHHRHALERTDGARGRLPPPARTLRPGLVRYRLASKLVKGQPLGGVPDEWVVIEPAYRAAELARTTPRQPRPTEHLCSARFPFDVRYNGSATGSTAPPGNASAWPRSPMALSTSGCCAGSSRSNWLTAPAVCSQRRWHLKHIAVATTEGYASAPAALKPNCSPRSTSTKPNATSTWSGPSSATTSKASCPPDPAPGI